MAENDYLKAKSMFAEKLGDLLGSMQFMEKQVDDIYKINMYLMRRYKDDLIKDLGIKRPTEIKKKKKMLASIFKVCPIDEDSSLLDQIMFMQATNKIKEIMNKEMPDPWYCYGIGNIKLGEQSVERENPA